MGQLWAEGPDRLSVAARGIGDGNMALMQTLAACTTLAGASAATVLRAEPACVPVVISSSGDPPAVDVASPSMRAALARESALMFPPDGANWIESTDSRKGSTLIVRIAGDAIMPHLLVLFFGATPLVARTRVARMMPSLVALVAAQLTAAATIAALEEQQSICALALDHDVCGVIAIRDDHSVLFANAPALAMLADGDGLHVKRGVIRPIDFKQTARFEAALDMVQDQARVAQMGQPPAVVMLLPSRRYARPLIITVVPADREAEAVQGATALIYLFQGVESARGLDTIAELHGLTGVERRLLAQLCAGLTIAESADHLRIKLETARAYLKQIFLKTDTHRQADLVALMTRYLRAVRGDFDFQLA